MCNASNALYVLVLRKHTSLKQMCETVSAKCRITQIVTHWVPSRQPGQQQRMPDDYTCWDCVAAKLGDDDWRNEDVVDWQHRRWECCSPSGTEELSGGGSYAPSTRVCTKRTIACCLHSFSTKSQFLMVCNILMVTWLMELNVNKYLSVGRHCWWVSLYEESQVGHNQIPRSTAAASSAEDFIDWDACVKPSRRGRLLSSFHTPL